MSTTPYSGRRFNLSKAIDDCCLHVTAAGIHQILTEGPKDVMVDADTERIQRVVVNFVNNAVKYATHSKIITIRVDRGPGMLKVSVIDQGPGVPPEKLPHCLNVTFAASSRAASMRAWGSAYTSLPRLSKSMARRSARTAHRTRAVYCGLHCL